MSAILLASHLTSAGSALGMLQEPVLRDGLQTEVKSCQVCKFFQKTTLSLYLYFYLFCKITHIATFL